MRYSKLACWWSSAWVVRASRRSRSLVATNFSVLMGIVDKAARAGSDAGFAGEGDEVRLARLARSTYTFRLGFGKVWWLQLQPEKLSLSGLCTCRAVMY